MVDPCSFIHCRLSKKHGVPPPHANIKLFFVSNPLKTFLSICLKYSSPFFSNICATDSPTLFSISLSRSKKLKWFFFAHILPQCVLPLPIKPMRKILEFIIAQFVRQFYNSLTKKAFCV